MKLLVDCFTVIRPKQWIKNLLVLAAPIASTRFIDYFIEICIAILTFMSASSLGYIVNDWQDREKDRLHKAKKNRPFASESLTSVHFKFLFLILTLITIAGSLYLGFNFALITLAYLLITFLYTFIVKFIPTIEMVWLASGFLIRALAGSILVEVKPTGWFNIAVFFGALFVVANKRFAEKLHSGSNETRAVLWSYDEDFLGSVVNIAASATLLTYCLWVIQEHSNSYLAQLSIFPFVACILLYKSISKHTVSESPEDALISNKPILISAALSCLLMGMVFYL